MNEEIKEILEEIKEKNEAYEECSENGIIENEYYKSHLLLNYITNLQIENKDNLKCIKSLKEQLESVINENQKLLETWHKNNDKNINLISENEYLKETNEEHRKINGDLRKENQKLKEKLNCKEYFSSTMPEDTEFVILTKNNYDRQQKDLALENIELKETNEEHRKINGMLHQENQKLVKVFDELLEDSDMMLKSLNYNSKNGIEIVQYKLANIINKLTELKGGSKQ